MRSLALILLSLSLVGGAIALPAGSQPAPKRAPLPDDDVIGSLLDPHHKTTALEEEEPDTAGQKQTRSDPDVVFVPVPGGLGPGRAGAGRPAAAIPYAPPPRPQLDRPVHIDEIGRTPDGPPTVRDMAYESRIRASFAAAEGFQGPLDGGWTLSVGADDLFALQIVDKSDRLEGVWRDLRRKGAPNASGLVDDMQRQGQDLTLRFQARPSGGLTVATLHAGSDGKWTGSIEDAGQRLPVVLRRTGL